MTKRRKQKQQKRWVQFLIVMLVVVVGFELASVWDQSGNVASGAAQLAQAAGPIVCRGNDVFVFSRDFSDADMKNTSRPIKYYLGCPGKNSLRFALNQSLPVKDACALASIGATQPRCTLAYYGVVSDASAAPDPILSEDDINTAHYRLVSKICKVVPYGSLIAVTDCDAVEKQLRAQYNAPSKKSIQNLIKTPPVTAGTSYKPSVLDALQQGLESGQVKITGYRGISPSDNDGSTGLLKPNPTREPIWGITFIFRN